MAKYVPVTKEELQLLVQDEAVYLIDIDVSLITDMSNLFAGSKRNNFPGIELWDVSNVTNMRYMFYNTKHFNQDISDWNVSNIIDMSSMFSNCSNFNYDLSNWDVSSVRNMYGMSDGCNSLKNKPSWYYTHS